MTLQNKRILVTGATGFIGGHLAWRLAQETGAIVTGTGRDLEKAAYLKNTGVTLRHMDLDDLKTVHEMVRGQDVVFHLAKAPGSKDASTVHRVNVIGSENLVCEAAEAGVKRFIHVSSMAAYGPPDQKIMTEDHPLDTEQSALYGQTKALGEVRANRLATALGLPVTIIRPGMVYGPRGQSWTINLFRLVKRGVPVILGDGQGHAHPVFIDNLIDGMILAATRPEGAGEAFNFMDQALPWREFLGYYSQMCDRKLRSLPLWLAKPILFALRPVIGRTESPDALLSFYTNRSVYPYTKAQRLLGYQPRTTIEEGMRRTEVWLKEVGYL